MRKRMQQTFSLALCLALLAGLFNGLALPVFADSNHAPVLTRPEAQFVPIDEDDTNNAGTTVTELVYGNTDADQDALGIAVIGQDLTNGTWEYYDANAWWTLERNSGPISETQALLLDGSRTIRFVPGGDFHGEASLKFRLWDKTQGAENTRVNASVYAPEGAFSSAVGIARIQVNPVNDPPQILKKNGGTELYFDGADDYLSVAGDLELNYDRSFTVETWVKPDASNNWSRIFDFGNGGSGRNQFLTFYATSGQPSWIVRTGKSAGDSLVSTSPYALDLHTWTHLAAVYNQTTQKLELYANGAKVASESTADRVMLDEAFRPYNYFGKSNISQDPYFRGSMYGMTVWREARTPSQLRQDMNASFTGNEPNLLLYYPLNEGAGSASVASVTGVHPGTLEQGLTLRPISGFNYLVNGFTGGVLAINQLYLKDVDIGSGTLVLDLSVSHGRLSFAGTSGLTFISGSNASSAMEVEGTLADLNAALATLSYQGDSGYTGADTLNLTVNDQGNSGSGGHQTGSGKVDIALEQGQTPVVDTHPANASRGLGGTAKFTVEASLPAGAPAGSSLTYQWQKSVDGGVTWTDIAGANEASYTTGAMTENDQGTRYRSVVANSYDGSETISNEAVLSLAAPPVLSAAGDNANNLVKLNWTSSLAGQEYYMVYQKDKDGSGLDEFQSIPLKRDIKVLNVYPDVGGSDGLQDWMEVYGNPSGYSMQVDKVSISDFNGDDAASNYAHYLAKDSNGRYPYDVLYFGAWDVNFGRDLSEDSHAAVDAFVQYGGGLLVGHDTASFHHAFFIDLAQRYLNMDVNFQEGYPHPGIPPLGSDQVVIQRRGFPMNYPYALGDVGSVLRTPTSHSYFQFAKGDIWFKYASINWGSGPEISSYLDHAGTNNFYLTTWNNAAMIQTGHSNGQATEDEQKILANTLFYLAQTSTANSFDDRMSQDVAAPNPVAGGIAAAIGSAPGAKRISWQEAEDNGSSYSYYLKAISFTDGSSRTSAETDAAVTTGVKGYAVTVDTDPSNSDPGYTVNTLTNSFETEGLQSGVTYYAHIRTLDRAGNASGVYTVAFTVDASGLTASSADPSGRLFDGKTVITVAEKAGQGNKLVYLNAGSSNAAVPGVGDELGGESGYQELPANGLIPAANGDSIAVAEVDASGRVVRFGQTVAQVADSAAELAAASVDPAGAEYDGSTRMVAGAGSGNKLVYMNFGQGTVMEPSQGQLLSGYTDLPAGGIIPAVQGDSIGIAEVDPQGRVVRFGAAKAQVLDEAQAKGLAASATDPEGTGTDGTTRVAAAAAPGNKLVYTNFKKDSPVIPHTGSSLSGLDYAELPATGLVEAENGDVLGIAEVDPAGHVVRYTTVPAAVVPESAAKGLAVGTKDAAGSENEGKTQITGQVGEGHRLVMMNFGQGPVTAPAAGQPAGSGYVDVPAGGAVDARNGDILGVAELDELGYVVAFGTIRAIVTPESAAKGLPVTSVDVTGSGTDGQTQIVTKAAEGNRLVVVNFGEGPVNVPAVGETLAGYAELPPSGVLEAKHGDLVGVAEIGPDGKVVRYGVTEAVVLPEAAAKPIAGVSTDPAGAGTDGKTKLALAAGYAVGAGNRLVYLNVGKSQVLTLETGAVLSGYAELPEGGLVDAQNGDNLGLAEVDAAGKVVRFAVLKAQVETEAAAEGLTATATDPAGPEADGMTRLASDIEPAEGNKLVYLNFGKGAVLKPNTGDTLNGYAGLPESGWVEAENGDFIGLAEVDPQGRVVRFGVTAAAVYADAEATGLAAAAADPEGAANNGKTAIQAKAATGNKLVYVNFGSGLVLAPNTGEILAGYMALPADGIIPAAHGDHIAVAEIDTDGKVVRFARVDAVVVADSGSGESGESDSGTVSSPSPAVKGVEVLVNGKVEYAGTATLSSQNNRSLTTIDVDPVKLQAKLDAEGQGAVVTVPWSAQSDIIIGQLTGQMIRNMEAKAATLVLDTPAGAYKIPAEQLHVAALAQQLDGNAKLEDVRLQLHIALSTPEAAKAAEAVAAKAGVTLTAAPVTFTVQAEYNGKSIEITDYSIYVERTVALPAGIDPNKITTGVVLEKDGTLRHVPTKVSKVNEIYYAQINSLTNSDYGVIWNPLEFADVANHWSKQAVNDLGSRLVVNGVGGGRFNPNADITRGEFAAIMVRGLGLRLGKGTTPFTDVAAAEWYAAVVNTAYKFGLIAGYEDGTFRPQERITRQEAMTIIARAMKTTGLKKQVEGKDLSQVLAVYTDAAAVADWAKEGVGLSVAAQVVNGRTAATLESGSFITRAEVAAVMQRLLKQSGLI